MLGCDGGGQYVVVARVDRDRVDRADGSAASYCTYRRNR